MSSRQTGHQGTRKRQPGTVLLYRQPGTPAVLDVAELRERLAPGDRLLPDVASVLALVDVGLVVVTSETAARVLRAWQASEGGPHEAARNPNEEKPR